MKRLIYIQISIINYNTFKELHRSYIIIHAYVVVSVFNCFTATIVVHLLPVPGTLSHLSKCPLT